MICQQVFLILFFLLINVPLPIFACPTGFIQSSINPTNCYYVGKQQSNIFDVIVDCSVQAKNAGFTTAYVASIHSAFESEEIRCTRVIILNWSVVPVSITLALVANTTNQCSYFIGLNDIVSAGQFKWFDGSSVTYTNWDVGMKYIYKKEYL